MAVEVVYWKGKIGDQVESKSFEVSTYEYRIAPLTQWKTLVADESVRLLKNQPIIVKIKDVEIPKDTIVSPLSIMRHAYGVIIDVIGEGIPKKVEEEKRITHAVFLPIQDGKIEEGDLIGVLKVHFVKVGRLRGLIGISPSDIVLKEELTTATITYRDNGNIFRDKIRTRVFGYIRSHIAEWEPVIADEDIEVSEGELKIVRIKEIELQPYTVITPLYIMRHPLGSLVDLIQLGPPKKVEEEKRITHAVFLPIQDGKIEEGDLIGVINAYYVATHDFKARFRRKVAKVRAKIAELKNGEIKRKEIEISPFIYKRKPTARWEMIIANEDREVRKGKIARVRIKPLKLEKNTILYPLYIMRNAYGTVLDLIQAGRVSRVEEEKEIVEAIFMPVFDGVIKKGQLLGVFNVYSVEVKPYEVLRKWLEEWSKQIKEAITS